MPRAAKGGNLPQSLPYVQIALRWPPLCPGQQTIYFIKNCKRKLTANVERGKKKQQKERKKKKKKKKKKEVKTQEVKDEHFFFFFFSEERDPTVCLFSADFAFVKGTNRHIILWETSACCFVEGRACWIFAPCFVCHVITHRLIAILWLLLPQDRTFVCVIKGLPYEFARCFCIVWLKQIFFSHLFCDSSTSLQLFACAVIVWRSVQKVHLHIQVSLTYVRIGGHVSHNLSWGTSDWRKIALTQNFQRVKMEWTEWIWHMSCSLCLCSVVLLLQSKNSGVLLKCLYFGSTHMPKALWDRISIFNKLKIMCGTNTVQTLH